MMEKIVVPKNALEVLNETSAKIKEMIKPINASVIIVPNSLNSLL